MDRMVLALAAALGGLGAAPLPDKPDLPPWNRTPVATAPFSMGTQVRWGQLSYAGGLYLTAPKTALFGGLSGLEAQVSADGGVAFAAVSDFGLFMTFTGQLDETGRLIGAGDLAIAPLRDPDGQPLTSKVESDAEDLSLVPDGKGWLVSFERRHRIELYADPFDAAGAVTGVNIPAAAKRLPANLGLEAIAALDDGRILAGAEDGRMWLCPTSEDPCPQVHGKGGMGLFFYLTGLDALPDRPEEFVASYRRPNPLGGVDVIIAHVVVSQGKAKLSELARLPAYVDNVEGLSAVRGQAGGYRLYLVTDNNYSERVLTRLLAFDWKP